MNQVIATMYLNMFCWVGLSEQLSKQLRVQEKLEPPSPDSGTVSNQYTLLVRWMWCMM